MLSTEFRLSWSRGSTPSGEIDVSQPFLPSGRMLLVAANSTPGSAFTRRRSSSWKDCHTPSSVYFASESGTLRVRTLVSSKPLSTWRSWSRLLIRRPAPVRSRRERATSATTSAERMLCPPLDHPPRPPSLSVETRFGLDDRHAGTNPKMRPVTRANANVKPSTVGSIAIRLVRSAGKVSGSDRTMAATASEASATPRAPPRRPRTRLSVRSCRITRLRFAPMAARTASSR